MDGITHAPLVQAQIVTGRDDNGKPLKLKRDAITSWFFKRWNDDQNVILPILGPTGSGKSNTALYIAQKINPNFDINNVVFHMRDFVERIHSSPKRSVIIFDEAGIEGDARKFWKETNEALRYLLQTQRYLNHAYIFTFPHMRFIDVSARLLFHGEGFCVRKGLLDFKKYETDGFGVLHRRYLYNERGKAINSFRIPRVNASLWNAYLKKKDQFNYQLRVHLLEKLGKTSPAHFDEIVEVKKESTPILFPPEDEPPDDEAPPDEEFLALIRRTPADDLGIAMQEYLKKKYPSHNSDG